MTAQVLARLDTTAETACRGSRTPSCGAGAPAAFVLRARPALRLDGVTLLAEQAEIAREPAGVRGSTTARRFTRGLHRHALPGRRVRRRDGDREQLPCAAGADKAAFVREAARLLAPGGRMVVADGFLKREQPARGSGAGRSTGSRATGLCRASRARCVHGACSPRTASSTSRSRRSPGGSARRWRTSRSSPRACSPATLVRRDLHIGRVRWGHVLAPACWRPSSA